MAAPTGTVIPEAEAHQQRPDEPVLLISEARGHHRHRRRRLAIVVIVLGLGVGAAVAAGTVFFRADAQFANDGRLATPSELKADSAACQAYSRALAKASPGWEPAVFPPVTVSDVSGTYAALLYIDGFGSWTCFVSSPSSVVGFGGSPDGSFSRSPSTTDPVTLSSPWLWTNVNAKFQMVEGQAGRNVSSITLALSDGTKIRPTLRDGYFVAFWPGTASVVSSSYRIGDTSYQSGGAPLSPSQEFQGQLPSN